MYIVGTLYLHNTNSGIQFNLLLYLKLLGENYEITKSTQVYLCIEVHKSTQPYTYIYIIGICNIYFLFDLKLKYNIHIHKHIPNKINNISKLFSLFYYLANCMLNVVLLRIIPLS